jgi:hypothetical protein
MYQIKHRRNKFLFTEKKAFSHRLYSLDRKRKTYFQGWREQIGRVWVWVSVRICTVALLPTPTPSSNDKFHQECVVILKYSFGFGC